ADLLHGKLKEQINWKAKALSNIGTIKEKIKYLELFMNQRLILHILNDNKSNEDTQAHERLFAKLCKVDVEYLAYNDPLCIRENFHADI
ncbi:14849_t:CDS:2, partial [Entrophospora sp. SA101]